MVYAFYPPHFLQLAAYTGYGTYIQDLLPLIEEAVKDEQKDQLFYRYLAQQAPSQEEREIITHIHNDEHKHEQMFRQMYASLTGRPLKVERPEPEKMTMEYLPGLEKAVLGEAEAIEAYSKLYFAVPGGFRDTLFEILMDEIKHGIRFNLLYAKNK
jgi:rubrerythrin